MQTAAAAAKRESVSAVRAARVRQIEITAVSKRWDVHAGASEREGTGRVGTRVPH